MRWLYALLVVSLSVPSAIGRAQTISPNPFPTKIQLNGLNAEGAATLIAKLEGAQDRLKLASSNHSNYWLGRSRHTK